MAVLELLHGEEGAQESVDVRAPTKVGKSILTQFTSPWDNVDQ